MSPALEAITCIVGTQTLAMATTRIQSSTITYSKGTTRTQFYQQETEENNDIEETHPPKLTHTHTYTHTHTHTLPEITICSLRQIDKEDYI